MNTAARPRPSAIPPAASTGTPPTTSTTSGTSGRVDIDPDMPTTLGPLRDDDVGAVAGDQPGLLRRAHHVDHLHAGLVRLVGEILRSTPGQREHRDALGEGDLERRRVEPAEHVVDAERTRGELSDLPDLAAQLVRRAAEASDDAEPTGIAHGGDELRCRVPGHARLEDGHVDPE